MRGGTVRRRGRILCEHNEIVLGHVAAVPDKALVNPDKPFVIPDLIGNLQIDHGDLRLRLLRADGGEPAVEALGGEEQEGGHEDHEEQARDDGSEEVLGPVNDKAAAPSAQAAAEQQVQSGQLAGEGEYERGDKGAEEGDKRGLDQRIHPAVRQQARGDGGQDDKQGETAQAEEFAHQQVAGLEAELAGGIAHGAAGIHRVRIAQQAHIFLPVEKIGEGGNEDEEGQRCDAQTRDPHGCGPLFFVPGSPDSHFFLNGLL